MATRSEPRLRVIWTDPVTGRRGYAVIDRMVNGLAGGGTRMRSGVTLDEVERLARTMSYKNGAFNLPGGGAKGGANQRRERVFDERAPVTHADGNRHVRPKTRPKIIGLCMRDVGERRASADRFVVVTHFGDEFGGRRAAAAHET